jgi:hypothetical protein
VKRFIALFFSLSLSISQLGRWTNRCYIAQCWEVRMRWPRFDFFLVTDIYPDIEVEGVVEDVKRSYYFVSLYVGEVKVAESTKSKTRSSVVKLEWKENNQM